MYSSTESAIPPELRHFAFYRCYEGVDASIPLARDHLRHAVAPLQLDQETVEDALTCLSELTTNAIRHTGCRRDEGFRVIAAGRVEEEPLLRLEVHDPARWRLPELPPPDLESIPFDVTSGRGLALVSALAVDTGCDRAPCWKAVWCELSARQRHMEQGLALSR